MVNNLNELPASNTAITVPNLSAVMSIMEEMRAGEMALNGSHCNNQPQREIQKREQYYKL